MSVLSDYLRDGRNGVYGGREWDRFSEPPPRETPATKNLYISFSGCKFEDTQKMGIIDKYLPEIEINSREDVYIEGEFIIIKNLPISLVITIKKNKRNIRVNGGYMHCSGQIREDSSSSVDGDFKIDPNEMYKFLRKDYQSLTLVHDVCYKLNKNVIKLFFSKFTEKRKFDNDKEGNKMKLKKRFPIPPKPIPPKEPPVVKPIFIKGFVMEEILKNNFSTSDLASTKDIIYQTCEIPYK